MRPFRRMGRRRRTLLNVRTNLCSMKITEDVRKFAAEQGVDEEDALRAGMEAKAREFQEQGSESTP